MRYYECQCSSCAAAVSHSHSPQNRLCVFQFPPIPSSPFSVTLCSSESISVTSGHIWTILRLWETWAHLISHLDSSTIRSQALCLSCSRSPDTPTETHIWKHTHPWFPCEHSVWCSVNELETQLPWESSQEATLYVYVSFRDGERQREREEFTHFPSCAQYIINAYSVQSTDC